MSSDITSCLELDKEIISSKIIVVKEIKGCDSAFISSCVIGHCVKNKNAVLIISTHNSILHYHNIGLKMNYNLQKSIESGQVIFHNIGEEIVDKLLNNEHYSLQDSFCKIKENLMEMQGKFEAVNVIFDGLSHLFDLQLNLREINQVCDDIIDLVRHYNNGFLLLHCNVASEDDITCVITNLLCHKAQIIVEAESLASGLSADVSGHLTVKYMSRKFDMEQFGILEQKPSLYLFKLFDRGVKLLAPGTV